MFALEKFDDFGEEAMQAQSSNMLKPLILSCKKFDFRKDAMQGTSRKKLKTLILHGVEQF